MPLVLSQLEASWTCKQQAHQQRALQAPGRFQLRHTASRLHTHGVMVTWYQQETLTGKSTNRR
jgi:hypothetical protein